MTTDSICRPSRNETSNLTVPSDATVRAASVGRGSNWWARSARALGVTLSSVQGSRPARRAAHTSLALPVPSRARPSSSTLANTVCLPVVGASAQCGADARPRCNDGIAGARRQSARCPRATNANSSAARLIISPSTRRDSAPAHSQLYSAEVKTPIRQSTTVSQIEGRFTPYR
eukprot:scaffold3617_cov119-Isochrysis_galbana.AAC.9